MKTCINCKQFFSKEKYYCFLLCIAFAVSSETTNNTSSGNCGQKSTWSVYMDFAAEAIVKAKSSSVSLHETSDNCGQKEALMTYLEVADEMINKAKMNLPICDGNTLPEDTNMHPSSILDCSDLLRMGHKSSGVYTISIKKNLTRMEALDVYCDMETDGGGWTVIQRRGDFQNPVDYFLKEWKSYKEGFGDLKKEFWLGNDNIYFLTNRGIYSARFDLVDVENQKRYAHYDVFRIDDEQSKYKLQISNYTGDAGDDMKNHNGQKFSTIDQDNDSNVNNCAEKYKGAWWFISGCFNAHLNGENIKGTQSKSDPIRGKIWNSWKGFHESLAQTEIKIRPKKLGS